MSGAIISSNYAHLCTTRRELCTLERMQTLGDVVWILMCTHTIEFSIKDKLHVIFSEHYFVLYLRLLILPPQFGLFSPSHKQHSLVDTQGRNSRANRFLISVVGQVITTALLCSVWPKMAEFRPYNFWQCTFVRLTLLSLKLSRGFCLSLMWDVHIHVHGINYVGSFLNFVF